MNILTNVATRTVLVVCSLAAASVAASPSGQTGYSVSGRQLVVGEGRWNDVSDATIHVAPGVDLAADAVAFSDYEGSPLAYALRGHVVYRDGPARFESTEATYYPALQTLVAREIRASGRLGIPAILQPVNYSCSSGSLTADGVPVPGGSDCSAAASGGSTTISCRGTMVVKVHSPEACQISGQR